MDIFKSFGIVLVLIIVVVGGFMFFTSSDTTVPTIPLEPAPDGDEPTQKDENVQVFRTSVGDVHTYRGVLSVPTPCHELRTQLLIAESLPEQVTIEFEAISSAELCAQVITEKEFEVTFTAHPDHTIRGFMNGNHFEFNVVHGALPPRAEPPGVLEPVP